MIKHIFVGVWLLVACELFGQSKDEQIKQLQKIARENEERAKKAEAEAEKYIRIAQEAQREADRQRYLNLAMYVSLKSVEIDDNTLAGLLALQAYNLNKKNAGYEYNREIYNALFWALKKFDPTSENLTEQHQPVIALVTKPQTQTIFSMEKDGRVVRWSKNNHWQGKEITPPRAGYNVLAMDVSAEGRPLIIASKKQGNQIGIYDVSYSSRKIDGFDSQVTKIIFTKEVNGFYALCKGDKSIFYSNIEEAREVFSTSEKIISIDLSRDGSKLACITAEGNLYLWDLKKDFSSSVFKLGNDQITSMAFAPTGRTVVFGNANGEIKFVDVENGMVKLAMSGNWAQIDQIVFSNSGKLMAVAGKEKSIRVWNLTNINRPPRVIDERGVVTSLSFSPDENQILCATGGKDFPVHVGPLNADVMAQALCTFLKRNFTKDEWERYIGIDFPYEVTCSNLPPNDK